MKALGVSLVLALGVALGVVADRGVRATGGAPAAATVPKDRPAAALQAAPGAQPGEDPKAVYRVPVDDTPTRGPADALVTLVEFSDLECPFCKRAAPVLKQIEEAYRGKVRVAWKHLPLSFHRNAGPGAMVAEAARAQHGDAGFWKVADALLAAQPLDEAAINRAGRDAGLDPERVRADHPDRLIERLRRDQMLAGSLGVRGTPTFFVNGRKVVGAQPFEALKPLLDEELAKADALVKSGVAARDVYARIIEKGATAPVMVAGGAPAAAGGPRVDVKVAVRPDDPARGGARPRVTVIEFSDFQCPFCSRAVPAVEEVEQAFGKDVRIVWKHMPLAFHANAMPAALAAEAARAQGKFWEMHDKLFANQQALSESIYAQYAKELGLDVARFEADRNAPATRKRVEEDLAAAGAAGVTGTPTFVVNGEVVVGSGGLRDAVGRQLQRAKVAMR